MCTVSMIGDYYKDKWSWPEQPFEPGDFPMPGKIEPSDDLPGWIRGITDPVRRDEFEKLKKEVEEMHELLRRAVEYDKRTNQPNCEMEDKVALLKKVAELVGVDLKDVFPNG